MSFLYGQDVPDISVTKDGTVYRLPVQQTGRPGQERPVAVVRQPKLSFPPPISIAGPEASGLRRNYDIDEITLNDWSRGMGVDIYPTMTPPGGYQYAELDTRVAGYLTPPPLATPLASAVTAVIQSGHVVTELGYTDARLVRWNRNNTAYRYDPSPAAWSAVQSGGSNLILRQLALGLNGAFAVGVNATSTQGIYRTWDGVTWDTMALGAITTPFSCEVFDDRLFVLNFVSTASPSRSTWTVYSSVDVATAAAGGGTWTAGNSFVTPSTEVVMKLFTWQYPLDRGKPTLWCLTTSGLRYYDYYAATPAWREWYRLRTPLEATHVTNADAFVWPKNGNLYTCSDADEFVMEFTGNTIRPLRINGDGGLPLDRRFAPMLLGGDDTHLFAFCAAPSYGGGGRGGVVAMAEGGSFHHIRTPDSGHAIYGGGVGGEDFWVVDFETTPTDTRVYEFDNPEATAAPHLMTTRSYEDGAHSLVTGWLHGNLLNVNKRLLQFEVDALKANGAPGLDTGCSIQIEYARRGAAFTSAGTLTASDTFPAVLAIAGGYTFKELQVRVTLDRGSTATQAPFLKALKVGYRPRPKQRYTYTARVDLRDGSAAFQTDDEKFHGLSASKLRGILDELSDNDDLGLDDTLVALAYGGFGNSLHPRRRSVAQAEVSIQAQESPDGGDGLYLLIFSELTASTSG